MLMFQSPKYYVRFFEVTYLYRILILLTMRAFRISLSRVSLSLTFFSHMLIRADAPVIGTLWEFIMAVDIEIG